MKFFYRAAAWAAFLFFSVVGIRISPSPQPFDTLRAGSSPAKGEGDQEWILIRLCSAEETTNLGEVTVTAPSEPSSPDAPSAFVSVIDPKPFVNQVKTLPELLSQQPGVNVQQFGGLGQLSTVSIRGSTSEQVTVLVDGVRLNTAQGGAVDFSTIPLEAIDRIEVIRGGASAQFGSDAIGGAINIITKRAKKKQAIEASVGGGSFGTFKTTEGYSRQFNQGSFLIDHTHLQSTGDFSFKSTATTIGGVTIGGGEEFIRENNGFFSENGLVKLTGNPSDKIHLILTTDWFGSKREVPPTEDEAILLAPANPPEARENLLRNITTLRTEFKSVSIEALSLHFQPYYRYDFDHFTDPSPALGGAIDVKTFNRSVGGQIGWDYWVKTRSVLQAFKLNYDLRGDLFDDQNLISGGPVSGSHQRLTNGIFFSDEISLLSERLLFNPSLRFENANDFGSRVALHLGIKGKPLSWMTLKSNVENSFRYPNFNELFFPNEGIIRGNPNLLPEAAINFDIGAHFQHRYGSHEISYFLNRIDNSIIFVPISAFTIAPINTRRANTQGVEVSTSITPWSHLEIDGNYTLLLSHLVDSGNQLPGRPKHKANLKVTLKNSWGSVYSTLQFIDDLPIDFQNTTFLKRRTQLDVGVTLKFLKHYYLAMEVKDVTNIQMLDARGFPLPRLSAFGSFGVRI
jgi:vitamin B12 transporter